jgi:hypothetical protein
MLDKLAESTATLLFAVIKNSIHLIFKAVYAAAFTSLSLLEGLQLNAQFEMFAFGGIAFLLSYAILLLLNFILGLLMKPILLMMRFISFALAVACCYYCMAIYAKQAAEQVIYDTMVAKIAAQIAPLWNHLVPLVKQVFPAFPITFG